MRPVLLAFLLLILSACGQKGPLYLPLPGEEEPPADTCRACPPLIMPAPTDDPNANATPEESTP